MKKSASNKVKKSKLAVVSKRQAKKKQTPKHQAKKSSVTVLKKKKSTANKTKIAKKKSVGEAQKSKSTRKIHLETHVLEPISITNSLNPIKPFLSELGDNVREEEQVREVIEIENPTEPTDDLLEPDLTETERIIIIER